MSKKDYTKTLEKIDNNPSPQNLRRGISLLVQLVGVQSMDTGIDHGHYTPKNLKEIPTKKLSTIYSDLKNLYGRLHPQPA